MVKMEGSQSSQRSTSSGRRMTEAERLLKEWTALRRRPLSQSSSLRAPKRPRHSEPSRDAHHSQPAPRTRHSQALPRSRKLQPRHSLPSRLPASPTPERAQRPQAPGPDRNPDPEPALVPVPNPTPRASERWPGDRIDVFSCDVHIASVPVDMLAHHPGGARWEHVLALLARITGRTGDLRPRRGRGACPPFANADRGEYTYVTRKLAGE